MFNRKKRELKRIRTFLWVFRSSNRNRSGLGYTSPKVSIETSLAVRSQWPFE